MSRLPHDAFLRTKPRMAAESADSAHIRGLVRKNAAHEVRNAAHEVGNAAHEGSRGITQASSGS
jgi:hypothetical protein